MQGVTRGCFIKIWACRATAPQTEADVVWGILQIKTQHKLQILKVPLSIWKDVLKFWPTSVFGIGRAGKRGCGLQGPLRKKLPMICSHPNTDPTLPPQLQNYPGISATPKWDIGGDKGTYFIGWRILRQVGIKKQGAGLSQGWSPRM